jgi:hypothetical protein
MESRKRLRMAWILDFNVQNPTKKPPRGWLLFIALVVIGGIEQQALMPLPVHRRL